MASCTWVCTSAKVAGREGCTSVTTAITSLLPAIATGAETSPFFKPVMAWSKSGLGPISATGLPASTSVTGTICMLKACATFSGWSGSFCSMGCALSSICCMTSLTRCFFNASAICAFTSSYGFTRAGSCCITCTMW